jgi:hypothetical protein
LVDSIKPDHTKLQTPIYIIQTEEADDVKGRIRQSEWLYDHYVDHIVYGMLAEDWNNYIETTRATEIASSVACFMCRLVSILSSTKLKTQIA